MTLASEHQALWRALQEFPLDQADDPIPFSLRLAREQGWQADYTRRVLQEYRRFLLLSQISPTPVTPSQAVDEVWHLHLCYTRSYWDELCGALLRRPLHHEPGSGRPTEGARHRDQYLQTLELYRETFGEEAPADIWPRYPAPLVAPPPPRRSASGTPRVLTPLLCGAAVALLVWFLGAPLLGVVLGILGGAGIHFQQQRDLARLGGAASEPDCGTPGTELAGPSTSPTGRNHNRPEQGSCGTAMVGACGGGGEAGSGDGGGASCGSGCGGGGCGGGGCGS